MKKVLVAYSGGVDSSYLGFIANQELGGDAVCVLGISPSVAESQRAAARHFAARHKLNLLEIETEELADQNYLSNPVDRCFYCKSELYGKLRGLANELSIDEIVDGSNFDDLSDIRPGRIAAIENKVESPLADTRLSKADIRELSLNNGLETWEKPASPCLSSRIAYGVPVTLERLSKIERAEEYLRTQGFREFRVRVHGDLARIELAKSEMLGFANAESFAQASAVRRDVEPSSSGAWA